MKELFWVCSHILVLLIGFKLGYLKAGDNFMITPTAKQAKPYEPKPDPLDEERLDYE